MDSLDAREMLRRAGRALRAGKSENEFVASVGPEGLPVEYKKLLRHQARKMYRHAQSAEERMRMLMRHPVTAAIKSQQTPAARDAEFEQLMANHERLMAHFK